MTQLLARPLLRLLLGLLVSGAQALGPAFAQEIPSVRIEALSEVFNPGERAQFVAGVAAPAGLRPRLIWRAEQAGSVIANGEGSGFSFDVPGDATGDVSGTTLSADQEASEPISVLLTAIFAAAEGEDLQVEARMLVRVNAPPAGGRVLLLPPRVRPGGLVEARAIGFLDEDGPLTYGFFLTVPDTDLTLPVSAATPESRVRFPAPGLEGEFAVGVLVEDGLGLISERRFPLIVAASETELAQADDADVAPTPTVVEAGPREGGEPAALSLPEADRGLYPGGPLAIEGLKPVLEPGADMALEAVGADAFARVEWRLFADGRRVRTSAGPHFEAPIAAAWAGRRLVVELSGRDGRGKETRALAEAHVNAPPTRGALSAPRDQVRAGAIVQVAAGGFRDPEGEAPLSYAYRVVGHPEARIVGQGASARLWTPLRAPGAPPLDLRVDVTAHDARGAETSASLTLEVAALPAP